MQGKEEKVVFDNMVQYLNHWLGKDYEQYAGRLWAHNAEFDHSFLYQFNKRNKKTNDVLVIKDKNKWGCTLNLFMFLKFLGIHDRYAASLSFILDYYGIPKPENMHHAINDARMGLKILERMLNELSKVYTSQSTILSKNNISSIDTDSTQILSLSEEEEMWTSDTII
jgi:DNA polymerase III epsilon subunit-like protein